VGDIVYGRRGDIGRRALVTSREAGWLCGTGCLRISLGDTVIDPGYLFYYLGDPSVTAAIAAQAIGATLPNLNTSILRNVVVRFPEQLHVQRCTAGILSAYDNLIEVNTRRIAVQEEMARRLFDEWFVNFRFPGHETLGAQTTENVVVPKGWRLMTLGEIATNYDRFRKPLSKQQRQLRQGQYPYYGAAKIFDYIDDYLFEGRYLLLAEDGSVVTNEGFPVLQLTSGRFWANNHTHIIRGSGSTSTEFLYLSLNRYPVTGLITGAAQPKITQANMNRIPVVVGPPEIHHRFDEAVRPIFDLADILRRCNAGLRTSRDLLLPKLISGEIDLTRAERGIEAAADQAAAE